MFFLLSKLLDFVLLPTVWLVLLALGALLTRRPKRRRRRLAWLLALLLLLTNGALVNEALLAWELPPVPLAAVAPADAAVLLTGVANGEKSPHDRVYLNRGADRLTNALWLYRAGKVRRILISGGSGAVLRHGGGTEAAGLYTLLRLSAVPDSALLVEDRSRNTRENALFTKELLAKHPDLRSLVLVTSAFHERRALGCFRRVGLQPQGFPADYRSTDRQPTPDYWLLPDPDALARWSLLLHELTGYAIYRLAGYSQ